MSVKDKEKIEKLLALQTAHHAENGVQNEINRELLKRITALENQASPKKILDLAMGTIERIVKSLEKEVLASRPRPKGLENTESVGVPFNPDDYPEAGKKRKRGKMHSK